jgi:hypothetical protein
LIGKSQYMGNSARQDDIYLGIVRRVDNLSTGLTETELKILAEDGNLGFFTKLKYVSELNKLRQYSDSHVRVPIDSIEGKNLADIQTAKAVNSIRRIYRYNPIDRCAEFVQP